jgi:surfeit locus 1 family protein
MKILTRAGTTGPSSFWGSAIDAQGLDETQRPGRHQQQKQSHRKTNTHRQCAYHLFGITLVIHKVKQGGAETRHDADHDEADHNPEEFHNRYYRHVKLEIVVGRRVFSPSWLMTVATLCLLVLFVSLGRWQWTRAEFKREIVTEFATQSGAVVPLGSRSTTELPRFSQVEITGRWDKERQFLLDNRTRAGRAGYDVLTPLRLDDNRWLLVNRGWIPFEGYRDRIPDVRSKLDANMNERVTVIGRLDDLPQAGLAGGRAAPATSGSWPRVTSFPTVPQLEAAMVTAGELEPRLEERWLLLSDADPAGYLRQWQPFAAGKGPEQNWSYAIQWWSFAILLLVLYFSLNLRKRTSS